jgi:hypothetical protein
VGRLWRLLCAAFCCLLKCQLDPRDANRAERRAILDEELRRVRERQQAELLRARASGPPPGPGTGPANASNNSAPPKPKPKPKPKPPSCKPPHCVSPVILSSCSIYLKMVTLCVPVLSVYSYK